MASKDMEDLEAAARVYYQYIRYTEKCINRDEMPLAFIRWYYLGRNGISPSTYAPLERDTTQPYKEPYSDH